MTAEKIKNTKLVRSESNKVMGGVCGGLGEFIGIDSTIVRWAFVLFTLFGGSGVLVYLVLWLIIPSPSGALVDKENLKAGVEKVKDYAQSHDSGKTVGLLLLALGLIFLFNNLGLIPWNVWNTLWKFWPVVLIIWGLEAISGNKVWGRVIVIFIALIILSFITAFSISRVNQNFNNWLKTIYPQWEENQGSRKVFRCDPVTGDCKAIYK